MATDDPFLERLLNHPGKAEALSWLTGGGADTFRNPGELPTTEESIELVCKLYEFGAVTVMAVEIAADADIENTGNLVVELPTDPQKRHQLFAWEARHARVTGFDPEEDRGQLSLFIRLDGRSLGGPNNLLAWAVKPRTSRTESQVRR
jgi:hypothetical protein